CGPAIGAAHDDMYDAFRHPRPERPSLPLLGPSEARAYIAEVRRLALDLLDRRGLPENRLSREGFVYGMVVQHEHQHDETMLATLQLMRGEGYRPEVMAPPEPAVDPTSLPAEVLVPAGPFVMGTSTEPWAYDNERPAHVVDLPAFFIDTFPVTNAAYVEFVESGGYDEPAWWTPEGWIWRTGTRAAHPQFWRSDGDRWWCMRFGRLQPLRPDEPVQHVCWHEATAYARFRGKRLPTEAEWEKASSWDPAGGTKRRYPWGDEEPDSGHANLGQRHVGPTPVGAYPAGASPCGAHQMIGDVWEWTASDFSPYPGFASFPYREYSEVFFGPRYKVLRGGSWATHPLAVRTTFRNWDLPIRRQIFAGLRLARDAT
ncbi:MAG: ergothioneine biosynthesis protein EgtB, partial [Acidimicrobiia bacterium]